MSAPGTGRENFPGGRDNSPLRPAPGCLLLHPVFDRPYHSIIKLGQPLRKDGKLIVISLRSGRLANRLTLFAHFIAMAEEQGYHLINFAFHSYAHLFETTRRDIYCRYPVAGRRSWMDVVPGVAAALRKTRICYQMVCYGSIWNERWPVFGRRVVTLREKPGSKAMPLDGPEIQAAIRDARIVFVHGWWFRAPPDWIQRHAEKIRAYFRPLAEHDSAGRKVLDRLRRDADIVVGVHIRQNDYRTWKSGRYFFPVSRYDGWMREMAAQFPDRKVAFFVCSDELRTAEEFPGLSVGLGSGSPVGDLCALAGCDYIFGPQSTFTQWASFYGNKPLLLLNNANDRLECAMFRVSCLEACV